MPKIQILKPFKFAHHGYQVEEFEPADEPVDTTDECAACAIEEGWAALVEVQTPAPPPADPPPAEAQPEEKAQPAAPENKDAAPKRSTKAAA